MIKIEVSMHASYNNHITTAVTIDLFSALSSLIENLIFSILRV